LNSKEIKDIEAIFARLPGLGPRSARRVILHLLKKKETLMRPLSNAIKDTLDLVKNCDYCGNFDTLNPCNICSNPDRDKSVICVVENVADLWALERTGTFLGTYHVLGGLLDALDGIGPEELYINRLITRANSENVNEIILATSTTVPGQTTAHYIAECLKDSKVIVTGLAHGMPMGGELDYMDEGTIGHAIRARKSIF